MSNLWAAADIHGYGGLLLRLLDAAGYRAGRDRLFLLGDYVNKGPDSLGTLRLVRALAQDGAVALQGNNERKWLRALPPELQAAGSAWEESDAEFLRSLPLWAECGPFLFVHAGIRPGVSMNRQTPEDLTEIREAFHASPAVAERIVVFGHTSTFRFGLPPERVWLGPGKLGIDTGAGHGYYLSLIDLTRGRQWYVSVRPPYRICTAALHP